MGGGVRFIIIRGERVPDLGEWTPVFEQWKLSHMLTARGALTRA